MSTMVAEMGSPVVENVILPRVKSIQKIAITNGINTRKLCAFCLILSLSAFVTAFIKTSGTAVALYRSNQELHLHNQVVASTATINQRLNGTADKLSGAEVNGIPALSPTVLVDPKRQEAAETVARFLSTDTQRWVTLTFNACGGLANMIWRFASIYGIGRYTGRRPFIEHQRKCWKWTMPEMGAALPGLYNATIYQASNHPSRFLAKRVTYGVNCCRYDNVTRQALQLTTFYASYKYIYLRGNILQSYKYFHEFKPEIREILEFSDPLKAYVKRYADALYLGDTGHKLCIHTRLGDFKKHFLQESRLDFTNPAVRFVGEELHRRYANITISAVLIGQDRDFLKKIHIPHGVFKTKYTVENLNRAEEIHFGSAHCDSLLLTASGSTFGWWMGYLMPDGQQDRVFYNIQASKDLKFGKDVYDYDSFPPEWRRLRLVENGTVVAEPRWRHQIEADEARERAEAKQRDDEEAAERLDVRLAEVEAAGGEHPAEKTEEHERDVNDGDEPPKELEGQRAHDLGPEQSGPEVEAE